MFFGEGDKGLGAINPPDPGWVFKLKNGLAECPCSTTNIQPLTSCWYRQPFQEFTGDKATPATNIRFVVIATLLRYFAITRLLDLIYLFQIFQKVVKPS